MKRLRALVIILGSATIFSLGLGWLFSAYPMMPLAASQEAVRVDRAFNGLLWLSIPIYALVMCSLIYSLSAFKSSDDKARGEEFEHSRGRWVEGLWLGVSLVLTLGLAGFGSYELKHILADQKHADMEIQVNASQFSWEFFYPEHEAYKPQLYLPVNKKVRLILKSADVLHSFWVPEFRLKQDVLPNRVTQMVITPTVKGDYQLRCSELCGLDHTIMTAQVHVVDDETYAKQFTEGESW
ncbi:MAG: cytochrome c oxidase subunit II [Elusimicrobia bacterium]|nr:cytochrome c oxidase subunit II [Elusimicrobiota bacterium]MBK7208602.1 cytochrome c oxidase subunit II [Elusimicrobiota bacterium]MBK7545346.1 cytochrome c oxidase subunit II [Elusimicrobiota bacterium]MBK7575636.1 cytochrome c oxidase subunit II [Elusimicrobiota bacterium]MBK7688544.1 cytochrome c oxidase subunit II [Elusimicrobiota bacterium]